jgi:hypothetical protein
VTVECAEAGIAIENPAIRISRAAKIRVKFLLVTFIVPSMGEIIPVRPICLLVGDRASRLFFLVDEYPIRVKSYLFAGMKNTSFQRPVFDQIAGHFQ